MAGPEGDSLSGRWFQASSEEDHVGSLQAKPQERQHLSIPNGSLGQQRGDFGQINDSQNSEDTKVAQFAGL